MPFSELALVPSRSTIRSCTSVLGGRSTREPNSRHTPHATRRPISRATGSVRARVFRDDNGNGLHDSGERLEQGALITAGLRPADRPTGHGHIGTDA